MIVQIKLVLQEMHLNVELKILIILFYFFYFLMFVVWILGTI